jgi:hypothetical protein
MEMLIRLKEIWAHVDPTMDHVEVIRRSFKMTLQKVDPAQRKSVIKKSSTASSLKTNINTSSNIDAPTTIDSSINDPVQRASTSPQGSTQPRQSTQSLTHSVKHRSTKRPTYYRREFDRALWVRAGSQCEFIDEKTGRRCDCRFGLQREHVIPLALGGPNDISNMQLLCATHNQLRARRVFGNKKVDAYQTRKKTIEPIM